MALLEGYVGDDIGFARLVGRVGGRGRPDLDGALVVSPSSGADVVVGVDVLTVQERVEVETDEVTFGVGGGVGIDSQGVQEIGGEGVGLLAEGQIRGWLFGDLLRYGNVPVVEGLDEAVAGGGIWGGWWWRLGCCCLGEGNETGCEAASIPDYSHAERPGNGGPPPIFAV